MNHHKANTRLLLRCCAYLATMGILSSGCSTLNRPSFLPKNTNSPSPSTDNSSISQLGVALPEMKPGDDRKLSTLAGQQLAKNGYWEEAVSQFRMAEELDPRKPKLDAELAPALAAVGQYAESLERYRRLVKAAPKDIELRNNYSWTLMESGDLGGAESEYRELLRLNPEHQRLRINLGVVLAKQGRTSDAFAQLQPVLGDAAAWHNIGVVAIDRGDEEAAMDALRRAANHSPAIAESRQLLAELQKPSELQKTSDLR